MDWRNNDINARYGFPAFFWKLVDVGKKKKKKKRNAGVAVSRFKRRKAHDTFYRVISVTLLCQVLAQLKKEKYKLRSATDERTQYEIANCEMFFDKASDSITLPQLQNYKVTGNRNL